MEQEPTLVIMFGSRVRKTAGSHSDIDIGVLAGHDLSLQERGEFLSRLSRQLDVNEDDIDLIELRNASPLLQHEAAETGSLLAGSSDEFIRFRVRAWKRYLDTAKLRRLRVGKLEEKLRGT